jgi:hypothetical protein
MMNGRELNTEIGVGMPKKKGRDNVVTDVLKKTTKSQEVYTELFLLTVSRPPTGDEITKLNAVRDGNARVTLGPGSPGARQPSVVVPAATDPLTFYQDVFWALAQQRRVHAQPLRTRTTSPKAGGNPAALSSRLVLASLSPVPPPWPPRRASTIPAA